jgi:hypothetical protein
MQIYFPESYFNQKQIGINERIESLYVCVCVCVCIYIYIYISNLNREFE